jgi:glycosyltransferase involved in cell wall biosynthesis
MTATPALALDRHGHATDRPATTTVLFTAHNRKDMVLRAIELALAQTVSVAIIVADDASSDGTREAVLSAYPGVTYLRSEVSHGPCFQRNRGLEVSATEIVFPLDDDSMLVSPHTLEQALAAFADPAVGIVAMPFQNILQGDRVQQPPEWEIGGLFFDFIACAHGVRRQAVIENGGYYEPYFYMGEETDLALRLYDRGWKTVICRSDPIHHMQPPARRSYRPDFYGRRNDVLFVYLRAPAMQLPFKLAEVIAKGWWFAIRTKRKKATFDGFSAALRAIVAGTVKRRPVAARAFAAMAACRTGRRELGY